LPEASPGARRTWRGWDDGPRDGRDDGPRRRGDDAWRSLLSLADGWHNDRVLVSGSRPTAADGYKDLELTDKNFPSLDQAMKK